MATTAKTTSQPGNDIIVELTVSLIGVGLLALLAGANKKLGTVVIVVMVGFLLGWLLINTTQLQGWLKKA